MTEHFNMLERPSDQTLPDSGLTIEFGNECNAYVDVIQQALDLALGNTGNLAPDSAVVDALDDLYTTAHGAGATDLVQLLVPLNQVLRSSEQAGFTLSQADTLLVQEAIIAITLGIDSIVNQKPTPVLLADVTQRVVDVAAENKHEIRANSEATGLVNVFVADADELLQRLFEQIQRWRASAFVGRGYDEVNRLLVTLRNGAETAGLSSIVTVVRLLIEHMSAQKLAQTVPDDIFFDLATETIEVLGDDLDRIRNNEQLIEHVDLYERLALEEPCPPDANIDAAAGVDSVSNESRRAADSPSTAEDDFGVNRASVVDGQELPSSAKPLQDNPDPSYSAPSASDAGIFKQGISETSNTAPIDGMLVTRESVPVDMQTLDSASSASWPDHRELVDALRSVSRGNDAIRERIEQLRRVIHAYPEARQVTIDSGAQGSAVSAVDNLFFKIDALLSTQRKSVAGMASVLGVEDQQTVAALGAGLVRHSQVSTLPVQYLNEANRVVIGGQLYDQLGYALRIVLDAVMLPQLTSRVAQTNSQGENRIVFDMVDDLLFVRIIGSQLQLSEFVVENASLRKVDEQMLKAQLPRPSTDGGGMSPGVSIPQPTGSGDELVTLAVFQRLIDLAAFHQGRVSTSLQWSSEQAHGSAYSNGEIELVLPVWALSEEVVLVQRGDQLFAVQAAAIESIEQRGDTDFDNGAHDTPDTREQALLRCKRNDGKTGVLYVDKILGKQTASVSGNRRLMLNDAYRGAFVHSDSSLVLVINPNALGDDASAGVVG